LNRSKILVVDDEKNIVDLISTNLSVEGFEVLSAFDGEEALFKARETRPDLILLDIMMPDPDGLEVCRLLKQNVGTSNIPVIMLTCLVDMETRMKSFDFGAVEYLTKPFIIDNLLKAIRQTLQHKILIVDDCEELRFALKIWFEEKGYEVTVASSGTEAISLLDNQTFQIAILDYNLGAGPDGLNVFYHIVTENLPVKTLFITSELEDGNLHEACSYGACGVLQKPFSLRTIEEKVRKILS